MLNLPYQNLKTSECGVIGSAFLAGLGIGAISEPRAAIRLFVLPDQEWKPDAAQVALYQRMIPIYTELLETSGPIHNLVYESVIQDGSPSI